MNAHFRLDFKTLGQGRERFDKTVAERPVSGHDILDIIIEQFVDKPPDHAVPKIVERPFVFRKIG